MSAFYTGCDSCEPGLVLTVGQCAFCPPPLTWHKLFLSEGIAHKTAAEIRTIWNYGKPRKEVPGVVIDASTPTRGQLTRIIITAVSDAPGLLWPPMP
jgi:hypothetical protein